MGALSGNVGALSGDMGALSGDMGALGGDMIKRSSVSRRGHGAFKALTLQLHIPVACTRPPTRCIADSQFKVNLNPMREETDHDSNHVLKV